MVLGAILSKDTKINLWPYLGLIARIWNGNKELLNVISSYYLSERDKHFFRPLAGRSYKVDGFRDIAGFINNILFNLEKSTLSVEINDKGFYPLLIATTTSRFECNIVLPSFITARGLPIHDPIVDKQEHGKLLVPYI